VGDGARIKNAPDIGFNTLEAEWMAIYWLLVATCPSLTVVSFGSVNSLSLLRKEPWARSPRRNRRDGRDCRKPRESPMPPAGKE